VTRLEGRALRDATADDYQANARRMGDDPPREEIERLAAADCELVDRVGFAEVPESPPPSIPEEIGATGKHAAEAIGAEVARDIPTQAPSPIETLGGVIKEKRIAMLRRIALICERVASSPDPDRPWAGSAYPHWAREVAEAHMKWQSNRRLMSEEDRDRRFYRALEDVCDRSRLDCGPWWVR